MVGKITLDLKMLLNIGAKGEIFIYIKLFLIIKKYFRVLFFKFKKGGINIFKHNNQ